MLVSFKFLTQVPIEEFVVQEHSRANKTSARLRSNASVKIERELQRKIKENYARAKLDKVLASASTRLNEENKRQTEKKTEKQTNAKMN